MTTSSETFRDERISDYGRLVETQRRLHRLFDRSLRSRAGISIVWFEALLRLARSDAGQMPITELGEALELTSGGATRLADRLEESGYIERVPCPSDRRVLWAHVTDQGRRVLEAATQVHLGDLDRYFVSPLSDAEMGDLRGVLRLLRPQTGRPRSTD